MPRVTKYTIKKKTYKKKAAAPVRAKLPITVANPFSTRVLNPKINDGMTPYSCGLKCQFAAPFTCFGLGSPMIMLLYPSITCGLAVYRSNGAASENLGIYPNHVNFRQTPNGSEQDVGTAVEKWRLVSQAMRLSLINNCEANDGYFEAIRIDNGWDAKNGFEMGGFIDAQGITPNGALKHAIPTQSKDELAATQTAPPMSAIDNTGMQPVKLPGHDTAQNYLMHNTYTTGKLKDLHKYVFQLRPTERTHEFTRLTYDIGNSSEELIDTNFDMIVIKIYGRSYPGNVPVDPVLTKIHAHVVSNQELVFDEASNLARFMTNTKYVDSEVEAMKRANTQQVKAGYISKMKS